MDKHYQLPARLYKKNGEERRVGIEIEMSGVELAMIACQINILYGGRIEELSPYEFKVRGTYLGSFKIELDYAYLKNAAREKYNAREQYYALQKAGIEAGDWRAFEAFDPDMDDFEQFTSDVLALVARNIVPFEVITPPLPIRQIYALDTLIQRLRDHGAKGTRHLLFYAFGVHLNPELPDLSVETLLRYFQAFLCLSDWLAEEEKVAFSRRVTPFINHFPGDYVRQVLAPNYHPTMTEFIDDYLLANPSRNRALDLLPLLAWIDEARVRKVLPEEKISRRPTLHYRLPNSDIDNPEWRLSLCWNNWVMVERLAAWPEKLLEMNAACCKHLAIFAVDSMPWRERVRQCIQDLSLR